MPSAERGSAAIVGVGHGGIGEATGRSKLEILAEASHMALRDAGVSLTEVDGIFSVIAGEASPAVAVAEYLGLRPRYADGNSLGGSSFVHHLQAAALALDAGLCETALICYGSNQRTAHGRLEARSAPQPYERPYRMLHPITSYALAASRHMHEFGTTREQLAEVAVAARAWASLNPDAFMRAPISIQEVLASRMVSDPLTVRDCCLVTDGGGAVVMVRRERAAAMRPDPIYLLGAAAATWHFQIASMPDLTVTAATESGARAFKAAGLRPTDVDVVELYDAFTINTILFLEDLGFCRKGEGGTFVQGGAIAPGGLLPVNTNGGGLSFCHPGMYGIFTVIEAVRQLRGECGARQVAGAEVALCHGNGGRLSSQVTALLGTSATL